MFTVGVKSCPNLVFKLCISANRYCKRTGPDDSNFLEYDHIYLSETTMQPRSLLPFKPHLYLQYLFISLPE